jgi:hypothetical protein
MRQPVANFRVGRRIHRHFPVLLAPVPLAADIEGDHPQPARKTPRVAQLGQPLEILDQRFLHDVLGVGEVAGPVIRQPVDGGLVSFGQPVKTLQIAVCGSLHKLAFALAHITLSAGLAEQGH